MNNQEEVVKDSPRRTAALLAETVASGLHSLAQPLTKVQWSLEMLAMRDQCVDAPQEEISDALVAIERVTAALDFLRCVISPFRNGALFEPVSVKDALWKAADERGEILQHEKIGLVLDAASGQGVVEAPKHVIDQISISLVDLLCLFAPISASVIVSDCEESVNVQMRLTHCEKTGNPVAKEQQQLVSNIRAYVEVLGGELEMGTDSFFVRISLPKSMFCDPLVPTVKK